MRIGDWSADVCSSDLREVLDALGRQGVLINVARGSVVDEEALIAALRDGRLGAAGLDVFADEPRVPQALKDMTGNVVLQPHQGSATHDPRLTMGRLVMENLLAGIAGKPLITPVNWAAATAGAPPAAFGRPESGNAAGRER